MFHFSLTNFVNFHELIMKPILKIKYERLNFGPIVAIELIHNDEMSLVVTNKMNDIEPRGEMGSLSISLEMNYSDRNDEYIEAPDFKRISTVKKIVSFDENYAAESGLIFTGAEGQTLTIASAVYPHSLYVSFPGHAQEGEREFHEKNYRVENIF